MTTITERARIARRKSAARSTLVRVTAKPLPPARYRAHCTPCRWSSRDYASYGTAEVAAKGHADERGHEAWVIDQYGLRVAGSTVRPGEAGT